MRSSVTINSTRVALLSLRHSFARIVIRYSEGSAEISRLTFLFLSQVGLKDTLVKLGYEYDVVSCQFSLHYAFEKEESIRNLLANVAAMLKPGGAFIGTMPSANRLVYEFRFSVPVNP